MRVAVPTNDHKTLAEDLFHARGIMVYLVENKRVKSRLFRYFPFRKLFQTTNMVTRYTRRYAEFLKKCDWLVVGKSHDGLEKISQDAGIRLRLSKGRMLEEIEKEIIHLKSNSHV